MFGGSAQNEDVAQQWRALLQDAEALIDALGAEQADTLAALRTALGPAHHEAGARIADSMQAARRWFACRSSEARRFAGNHPWHALSVAGTAALVLGAWLLRARQRAA